MHRVPASRGARPAARDVAFQAVFDRLTRAGGRAGHSDEAVIVDRIAAELLRTGQRDARGIDGHLRFSGLHGRLRAQTELRSVGLRCAVLSLLYFLRGDAGQETEGHRGAFLVGGLYDVDPSVAIRADIGRAAAWLAAPSPPLSIGPASVAPRLGWRRNVGMGGGPPASLLEPQLLRDLLHALQGVDSSCFKFRHSEGRFEVDPSVTLPRPAWMLTRRVLELGGLHMRLCQATNSALESESGGSLLHQALCEALRDQLRDYYKVLALLTAKADSHSSTDSGDKSAAEGGSQVPDLTLRRLWVWLQGPLDRMRLLVSVCEACQLLRGGALASVVHGFSRVGDGAARETCAAMLRRVASPLLSMLRAWMTEGELRDPFGEFFVCADSSVPLQDLWTRMYSLEIEMVPCFMTLELARKVLLTGKSVNFIRLCCPGQEWLPETYCKGPVVASASPSAAGSRGMALPGDPRSRDDVLVSSSAVASGTNGLPLADLSASVEQAAMQANQHLVSLMMNQYALGEHCLALRRFLLLGQGDFVESLMDLAEDELGREAGELYRHRLMGILDMAVRQSNAQFCKPDTVARLSVKLLAPSPGERGWDIFLLDYTIDSPLHVVFSPDAMQQYDRAFAFLWKLRRVSHSLASCWSQHMALQRHMVSCGQQLHGQAPTIMLEMRQTLHKCGCLRNEMHHFVQNVHSYVMCGVLDSSWATLQTGWRACTDLDQVILEHQRYLGCIEEGAFLSPSTEPVLTALTNLFALALNFTELHEQVCASAFEAVEVLSREPGGPLPFARSLSECRAQLDQLGANFLVRLQSLLRLLEGQNSLRQLASDLRFLLCRLDFNGYYEQKRTAPLAERIRMG